MSADRPAASIGEIEEVEHTQLLTECCEVSPEYRLTEKKCPDCGRWNPRTIKRVTIERRVVHE